MLRAIVLATALPSSRRTRYRLASTPAEVPALVMRLPASTNSTSGSTRAFGKRRASSSAYRQWVVQSRPSSRPAAPSTNAPEQTLRRIAPRASARRSAVEQLFRVVVADAGRRHRDQVGVLHRLEPEGGMTDAPVGLERGTPGSRPQTRKSNGGESCVAAIEAEDLADHAELEHREVVDQGHRHRLDHASECTGGIFTKIDPKPSRGRIFSNVALETWLTECGHKEWNTDGSPGRRDPTRPRRASRAAAVSSSASGCRRRSRHAGAGSRATDERAFRDLQAVRDARESGALTSARCGRAVRVR